MSLFHRNLPQQNTTLCELLASAIAIVDIPSTPLPLLDNDLPESLEDTLVQTDLQREQSRELSLRADRPPLSIKGYTFVRRLGTGAYGSVWLAREDNTGKNVSIKFYTHRRGLDWSLLNREVEKLAVLYTSRNIVGILDVGWNSDPPYYVMEYLENGSLAAWLEEGTLPVDESVRVATGIARGLVHAHGSGILHCDLKPANVLFDGEKEPRLCDFGQSRLSHEQNPALGTLFFMAPEQADLRAVPDARWDVYALGALLYQMLTGTPPYRTTKAEERIRSAPTLDERLSEYRSLIETSPAPEAHRVVEGKSVDSRLINIIDRCLATNPKDRFRNAQAVLEQLESRERQRQRAPLLRLGVLGPLLLLAAMAPLFLYIINRNVRTLETELTERALESDALTARVKAQSLEDELNRRVAEFQDVLANPALVKLLDDSLPEIEKLDDDALNTIMKLPPEESPPWVAALDAAYQRVRKRGASKRGGQDASWFMNSTSGRQLYRRGAGKTKNSLGRYYWSRDYFHGGEGDLPHDPERTKPRDPANEESKMFAGEYHVSVPFLSTATNRYMIAVTVKIHGTANEDGERPVIGLLGRTIHLDDFRGRFIERIRNQETRRGQIDREIALVDRRTWQLLDHSWIADVVQAVDDGDENAPVPESAFNDDAKRFSEDRKAFYQRLRLPDDVVQQFENTREDEDGHVELRLPNSRKDYRNFYADPVGQIASPTTLQYRGDWFAALYQVNVGNAKWIVIIQERADNTRESARSMSSAAIRYGLLAILTSIIGLLAVWWFVIRTMKK